MMAGRPIPSRSSISRTRRIGSLLLLASLTVIVTSVVLAQESRTPVDRATFAVLQSFTADERVAYEGDYLVEIESPRLDYAADFHVVNDPSDPAASLRELNSPILIDGEPVEEGDEGVEIIEQTRPSAGTRSVGSAKRTGGPINSGTGTLASPLLASIAPFEIVDSRMFRENYRVRELDEIIRFERAALVVAVRPNQASLPHFRLVIDRVTGLLLESEKRFPERPHLKIHHRFVRLTIQPGSLPLATESIPEVRLPDPERFELTPEEAREIVPGFRLPRAEETPEGFRVSNLRERADRGGRSVQVLYSNGLESFFVLARRAAFHAPDPIAEALPRIATDLGLEGVDPAVKERVLETWRVHLEQVFRRISEREESARGARRATHVAWRRTQLGITRFTVFSTAIDLLMIGAVDEGSLLASTEYLLSH